VFVTSEQILGVLSQFNPWWSGQAGSPLPQWHRAAFPELLRWTTDPPVPRAVLLSGARQVGKTTLLRQLAAEMLRIGVPASNILYATFDHPMLKLAGVDTVVQTWRQRELAQPGPEYLLLDEAQFIPDWAVWMKHQVDFRPERRLVLTGSAMPLLEDSPESGVGRLHTLRLTTLSFYEFLQLRETGLAELPELKALQHLWKWSAKDFAALPDLTGHFHDYLLRGGFPQTTRMANLAEAQRLLREDVIDKVLKRDMTAVYGVRRIVELEHLFLYLCLHDGGILNLEEVGKELRLSRPTVQNFLQLLESAHLIFRLPAFGYGKEVLRGRPKIYLADPAISPAVLLRGKEALEDFTLLGIATESAVFKHLFARFYAQQLRFSYWRAKQGLEVDVVGEVATYTIPFEVKYRSQQHTGARELKGLLQFYEERKCARGYVITRDLGDIGPMRGLKNTEIQLMKIPAPLFCYWMGRAELADSQSQLAM